MTYSRLTVTQTSLMQDVEKGLENFIEVCKDPQLVKQMVSDPKNINKNRISPRSVHWYDLSLIDGYGAFVLFFSIVDHVYPEEKKFDLIAHRYILEIKNVIEKNGLPSNGSLYTGTAGLCYAISFASKQRTRYEKMLSTLESYLLRQLSEAYIPKVQERLHSHKPINFSLYDVIQGFTGIGLYFIKNNLTTETNQIIEKLLNLSIQITAPIKYHNHWVPGWICLPEFFSLQKKQFSDQVAIFNMGLSHGVPSLLGFMSIALKAGIQIPGQTKAMKRIIEWLKSKVTNYKSAYFFKSQVTFEEQINQLNPQSQSYLNREAWCYGTPGVIRTLYLAGMALNDKDTMNFAEQTFLSIFNRSYEQWKLAGPTFCHGVSGLFLITYLMAKDTQNDFLWTKVKDLEKILFQFYSEDAPFGFRDFDLCRDGSYCQIDKASLLTGATGAWLSWLTTRCESMPNWYYLFMINYA